MNHTVHNNIISFIWGIADHMLRKLYVTPSHINTTIKHTQREIDIHPGALHAQRALHHPNSNPHPHPHQEDK